MAQVISLSGQGPSEAQSRVYIIYDRPQLETGLTQAGQYDYDPGFMYLMGSVVHKKDQFGNVISENPNKDGSLPV